MSEEKPLLTSEVRAMGPDERAALMFRGQIKHELQRIEVRRSQMEEAKMRDPRDPNIAFDLDDIEQRRSIIRGYEDAIRGCGRRAAEAKKQPAPAAAASPSDDDILAPSPAPSRTVPQTVRR